MNDKIVFLNRPKLGLSAHYCEATEKGEIHEY
jgi:hypothetical protein